MEIGNDINDDKDGVDDNFYLREQDTLDNKVQQVMDTSNPEPIKSLMTATDQLLSDIKITQVALDQLLGAQFTAAQESLLPLVNRKNSLYGSLGMGVLFYIKSMFTFDPIDIEISLRSLDESISIAKGLKKGVSASTIYSRIVRIFKRPSNSRKKQPQVISTLPSTSTPKSTSTSTSKSTPTSMASPHELVIEEEEGRMINRHAELVMAEAILLRTTLSALTDTSLGGWLFLIKKSLDIRSCYLTYHNAFNQLATAQGKEEIEDAHYESGVLFGIGLINIMFSILPPRIFQLFSYLGYTGSVSIGVSQLKAAIACKKGLHAPLAELSILLFYTVLSGSLALVQKRTISPKPVGDGGAKVGADHADGNGNNDNNNKIKTAYEDDKQSDDNEKYKFLLDIIEKKRKKYPKSPFYIYFHARYLTLKREIEPAIALLEEALKLTMTEWPQLLHACAWDLLALSVYKLNWKRSYELAKLLKNENKWSTCFAIFLEAIFLANSSYAESQSLETRAEIFNLLKQVPFYKKKIAGKTLPIEKYAISRAQRAIELDKLPFYPEYELLLAWDGFSMMQKDSLDQVYQTISPKGNSNQPILNQSLSIKESKDLYSYQKVILLLVRAAILRSLGEYDESIEAIKTSLELVEFVPRDSYLVPMAHIEWAQVALFQQKVDVAKEHYEISTAYDHRCILQGNLQLRQAKLKVEIERLSSNY